MWLFYILVVLAILVGATNRVELALQTHDSQIARWLGYLMTPERVAEVKVFLAGLPFISMSWQQLTPKSGTGYWFGIVGSLMMLSLLLYRSRKSRPGMQRLGTTAGWFRWHEVLGVLGPLLILFHANFQLHTGNGLRDITSMIALATMLIVTASGFLARYLRVGGERGPLAAALQFLHLPLFMITIAAAIIHVIAVHMF